MAMVYIKDAMKVQQLYLLKDHEKFKRGAFLMLTGTINGSMSNQSMVSVMFCMFKLSSVS